MRSVTGSRWQEAQVAEQEYWRPEHFAIAGFLETAVPQALTASWAAARIPKLPGSPWLELGIGPLGVGCMHFLPGSDGRTLFAADTLKRIPADEWQLPTALRVVVGACQASNTHLVRPSESTGFSTGEFQFVIAHNMLDHVRDPCATLQETRRILANDGLLLVACDTYSPLGRAKLRAQRNRLTDTILIRAHPFRFGVRTLETLISQNGFDILESDRAGPFRSAVGHSYLTRFLARAG